jgi:putative membrane protein
MSFQRTRLSADRTLMSVIRTALSMIGFGFTIAQVFQKMHSVGMLQSAHAGRNFGITLIILGCVVLGVGIAYDIAFMRGLRRIREDMQGKGLVHAQSGFPVSFTLLSAVMLLFMGLFVFGSMTLDVGPFR